MSERIAAGETSEPGDVSFEAEGVKYVLVTTHPHGSRQQARRELEQMALEATDRRFREQTGSDRVAFWFPVDLEFVRGELLVVEGERFRIVNSVSDSHATHIGHALLRFDEAYERRLRAVRVASRSMQIVAIGGALLALLAVAFAFLRLDRATRGLYTGRLQTWSAVACGAVVLLGVVAAYWIPWI